MHRYLGVDFSGNAEQWKPRCSRSNVWISVLLRANGTFQLFDLFRIQDYAKTLGMDCPFEALGCLLRKSDFVAAGIDAPFSVPSSYVPLEGHLELLRRTVEITCEGRPFAKGVDFIRSLIPRTGAEALTGKGRKLYRATEEIWSYHRVNVRSTTWNGPRGGAPFTTACLSLLADARMPMWPWVNPAGSTKSSLLVEAFPAAQLWTWKMPHTGYNGSSDSARKIRESILEALPAQGLRFLCSAHRKVMLDSADALDSLLCAFAGVAVAEARLSSEPSDRALLEGWIAVHH